MFFSFVNIILTASAGASVHIHLPDCDKKQWNKVCLCLWVFADLFSLFASEQGVYAARDDMEAVLRVLDGEVPPSLRKCFSEVS